MSSTHSLQNRLTVEEDTKIPNAATIIINKEDHTLAGMLRSQLLQMEHVLFAGYKVPHPLEPRFLIKIQTDSESTPIQAVQEACRDLIQLLAKIRDELQKEFDTAKSMGTIAGPSAVDVQNAFGQGNGIMEEGLPGFAGGLNGYGAENTQASGFSEFI